MAKNYRRSSRRTSSFSGRKRRSTRYRGSNAGRSAGRSVSRGQTVRLVIQHQQVPATSVPVNDNGQLLTNAPPALLRPRF